MDRYAPADSSHISVRVNEYRIHVSGQQGQWLTDEPDFLRLICNAHLQLGQLAKMLMDHGG